MRNLKLKESIYILKEGESQYKVLSTSTRRLNRYSVDGLVKEVINHLKDPQPISNLRSKLEQEYSGRDIDLCISSLIKEGIIREYDSNSKGSKFYKQLLFIDELTESWDETLSLQRKIEDSKIAVFGIGGIGTWIVNGLSQIGIGEIKISDPDVVERSNLNRQLYFSERDIGRSKVEVIKERISDSNIKSYRKRVSHEENLDEIIDGLDFIVNCADQPSVFYTSSIIDNYSRKRNIPYSITGGYNMHLGMIGPIIVPKKTATLQDLLKYQKDNDPLKGLEIVKDVEQSGNLGPIAGAVANIQVIEILKHIIGKGKRNYNRFAEIDFMDFSVKWKSFGDRGKDISSLF
tara:strand:- start:1209 stop:2249 length:1041 start_codon:yes stop_codon:yes gene_type:complete